MINKNFLKNLHIGGITPYLDIPIVKKTVSLITLVCFTILILWTSGYSVLVEKIEEQRSHHPSVYHKYATVREQFQHKALTEVYDKQTNQIYRFDKEGKLAEIEDRNENLIYKYEYDSNGNAKVKIIKTSEKETEYTNTKTTQEQTPSVKKETKNFFLNFISKKETKERLNTQTQKNQVLSTDISSWLKEYFSADPQKQQIMLKETGLTDQQVKELSEETKQKIAKYLASISGKHIESEVTVKELSKRTSDISELVNKVRSAITKFFVDIVKRVVAEKKQKEGTEIEVSIEDIQNAAKLCGVELNATKVTSEELKKIIQTSPVIVHLRCEDGSRGIFLVVTDFKDGKVIGIDSDGKTRVLLSESEFFARWTGKILSLSNVGIQLDIETKKTTKGRIFSKLFEEIKKIFIQHKGIQKVVTTQGNVVQQQNVAQTQQQTTQPQNAQEAISYIEQQLNEYLTADPAKKAQIAAQLGLSVDQLANLTAEQAQQIIAYLKQHADTIINCAVEALKNALDSAGIIASKALIAAKAILIDILTGNFQINSTSNYDASQVQISMFALQKVATSFGVQLVGYSTDIEGLKQALSSGKPVIVRMDLGGGMGHYVTVTGIENGQVIYKDADGKTYSISIEEFKQKTKGNIKILSQTEIQKGEKLTDEQLKTFKGARGGGRKGGRGGRRGIFGTILGVVAVVGLSILTLGAAAAAAAVITAAKYAVISAVINIGTQLAFTGKVDDWNGVLKAAIVGGLTAGLGSVASAAVTNLLRIAGTTLGKIVAGAVQGAVSAGINTAVYGGNFLQNIAIGAVTGGITGGIVDHGLFNKSSFFGQAANYFIAGTINSGVTQLIKDGEIDPWRTFAEGAAAGVSAAVPYILVPQQIRNELVTQFPILLGSLALFHLNCLANMWAYYLSSYVMFELYTKRYIKEKYGVDISFDDYLDLEDENGRSNIDYLMSQLIASAFETAVRYALNNLLTNLQLKYTDYTYWTDGGSKVTISRGSKVRVDEQGDVVDFKGKVNINRGDVVDFKGKVNIKFNNNDYVFGITTTGKAEVTFEKTDWGWNPNNVHLINFKNLSDKQNTLNFYGVQYTVGSGGQINFEYENNNTKITWSKGGSYTIPSSNNNLPATTVTFGEKGGSITLNENGGISAINAVDYRLVTGVLVLQGKGSLDLTKGIDVGENSQVTVGYLKDYDLNTNKFKEGAVTTTLIRDSESGPLKVTITGKQNDVDPIFNFRIEKTDNNGYVKFTVDKNNNITVTSGSFSSMVANGSLGEIRLVYEEGNSPHFVIINGDKTKTVVLASQYSNKDFVVVDNDKVYLLSVDEKNKTYSYNELNIGSRENQNGNIVYNINNSPTVATGNTRSKINIIVADTSGNILAVESTLTEIKVGNDWKEVKTDLSKHVVLFKTYVVRTNEGYCYYDTKTQNWVKAEKGTELNGWKLSGDTWKKELQANNINIILQNSNLELISDEKVQLEITSDSKLKTSSDVHFKDKNGSTITLQKGAALQLDNNGNYVIVDGKLEIPKDATLQVSYISPQQHSQPQDSAYAALNPSETNAKIITRYEKDKVTYEFSDGTVEIRNGNAYLGVGTVYKTGSKRIDADGNITWEVTSGAVEYKGVTKYNNRVVEIYVAHGKNTTAKVKIGEITYVYGTNGVKEIYIYKKYGGNNTKTLQMGRFKLNITEETIYFKTTKVEINGKQYNIADVDSEGKLIVDKIVGSYEIKDLKGKDIKDLGFGPAQFGKFNTGKFTEGIVYGKFITENGKFKFKTMNFDNVKISLSGTYKAEDGTKLDVTATAKLSGKIQFDVNGKVITNNLNVQFEKVEYKLTLSNGKVVNNPDIQFIEENKFLVLYNQNGKTYGYYYDGKRLNKATSDITFSIKMKFEGRNGSIELKGDRKYLFNKNGELQEAKTQLTSFKYRDNKGNVIKGKIGKDGSLYDLKDKKITIPVNITLTDSKGKKISVQTEITHIWMTEEGKPLFGARIKLKPGQEISNVEFTQHISRPGPTGKITTQQEKSVVVNKFVEVRQGPRNGTVSIRNTGSTMVGINVIIPAEEVLSNKIKHINFVSFEAGTQVKFITNVRGSLKYNIDNITISDTKGNKIGSLEIKDAKYTISAGTIVNITREGGIFDNLDGVKEGKIIINEKITVRDITGKKTIIIRNIGIGKNAEIKEVKASSNKVYLTGGYYLDFTEKKFTYELGVHRTAGQVEKETWKGVLIAAATGAATGAAIGALGLGIGAIPGAVVGAILGAGGYVLNNILSGGKAGGFTGNKWVDGVINGILGGLSVLGGAGILTQLSTKVANFAKGLRFVSPFIRAINVSTKISSNVLTRTIVTFVSLQIAAHKVVSSYNNFKEGNIIEGIIDLSSAGIALIAIPTFGILTGTAMMYFPENLYLAGQSFVNGEIGNGLLHITMAVLPFISGGVSLLSRSGNEIIKGVASNLSLGGKLRNFFLPFTSGVNSVRSALPIIFGGAIGAAGGTLYALRDGKFDGLKDIGIIAGFTLGGMVVGASVKDMYTNITSGIRSFSLAVKTQGWLTSILTYAQSTAANTLYIMGSMAAVNLADLAMYKTLGFSPGVALGLVNPNDSFENIISRTFTDPQMLLFTVGASLGWNIFNPLLMNIPILGPTLRCMSTRGNFWNETGKLSNFLEKTTVGRAVNRYASFMFEEGFQERPIEYALGYLQQLGLPIPHTLSEIVQEAADRKGGLSRLGNNFNTASEKISHSGFFEVIGNIKSLNSNTLQNVNFSVNNIITQQSITNIKVEIVQSLQGAEVAGKVKIVDTAIQGAPVILQEITFNTAAELQNIMLSVAETAVSGVNTPYDFATRVEQNFCVLNNNENNANFAVSSLSLQQKVDFLHGISVFYGVKECVSSDGKIDINSIKEYTSALNNSELAQFVIGVLPVTSNLKKDNTLREQLQGVVVNTVNSLVQNVNQNPTIENLQLLVEVINFIYSSNLPSSYKKSLVGLLLSSLHLGIASVSIPLSVTKESPYEEQKKYQMIYEELIPSLNILAENILFSGDKEMLFLFQQAIVSNPQLVKTVKEWSLTELAKVSSVLQQTEISVPVLHNLIDNIKSYNQKDIEKLLQKIDNVDVQKKLNILNFVSTILAERIVSGMNVENSLIINVISILKSLDTQQMSEIQKRILFDTIAKLEFVSGLGVTEEIFGKDVFNLVKSNKDTAYKQAKDNVKLVYGNVVEINNEVKQVVSLSQDIYNNVKQGKYDLNSVEQKLRDIYSLELQHSDEKVRQQAEQKLNKILENFRDYIGSVENLNELSNEDKAVIISAGVMLAVVEYKVQQWKTGTFKFNSAQRDAFKSITAQMFAEKQQHRYTHLLQTGGGKTFIAVLSTFLLRAQTPNNKFVAVFTNTIDNAKDLKRHYDEIFGNELGDVVVIDAGMIEKSRENPKKLNETLQNASIVVTTYDIWSGLVAQTFSTLLSEDKPYGKHNLEILKRNGVEIIKDAYGRTTFADATQAQQALDILLKNGMGLDSYDIPVPLSKIGSAVADEIDFFSTIPMQALAVSQGKYYKAVKLAKYYSELKRLITKQKITQKEIEELVQNYRELSVDQNRINRDLENSKKEPGYIDKMISVYQQINNLIEEGLQEKEVLTQAKQNLPKGVSEEQLLSEIKQFRENCTAIEYFKELVGITSELYNKSNPYKGEIRVGDKKVKISDIWQYGSKGLIEELMGIEVEEDISELDKKVSSENKQEVDLRKLIREKTKYLWGKYNGLFTEQQIIEHLWNGIGAHGMKEGHEYTVRNNRIYITNLGREVENLTLPAGMMQVLEAKHNVDISRPNSETYISNSVFAMSLFNDIVGLTGTVSTGVDTSVLKRMEFEKSGTAPKVESHWRLFQTQKGMVRFISEFTKRLNNKGIANFNLIITPNSALSKYVYQELLNLGIDENEIKFVYADVTDEELVKLRDEVKEGKYKFVIADGYLLGRGWNVGKMLEAADMLKKTQNATSDKVQATLWLLEPELMTETQMRQAAGRIDPFGDNRFDTSKWTKDIISLVSVENAREVETLREQAKKNNWEWTIDIITENENLHNVQVKNEEEALTKAGQKIVVSAEREWVEQQKESPPTVEQLDTRLNNEGFSKDVKEKVKEVLGIDVKQQKLTPQQYFRLNIILQYYDLLKGVLISPDDTILLNLAPKKDEVERIANIPQQEYVPSVIELLLTNLSTIDSKSVKKDVLTQITNIKDSLQKVKQAQNKLEQAITNLTVQQRQQLQELIAQSNGTKVEQIKLLLRIRTNYPNYYNAAKEFTKAQKILEKDKDKLISLILKQVKTESDLSLAAIISGIEVNSEGNSVINDKRVEKVNTILNNIYGVANADVSIFSRLTYKDITDIVEGEKASAELINGLVNKNPKFGQLAKIAKSVQLLPEKRVNTIGDVIDKVLQISAGTDNQQQVSQEDIKSAILVSDLSLNKDEVETIYSNYVKACSKGKEFALSLTIDRLRIRKLNDKDIEGLYAQYQLDEGKKLSREIVLQEGSSIKERITEWLDKYNRAGLDKKVGMLLGLGLYEILKETSIEEVSARITEFLNALSGSNVTDEQLINSAIKSVGSVVSSVSNISLATVGYLTDIITGSLLTLQPQLTSQAVRQMLLFAGLDYEVVQTELNQLLSSTDMLGILKDTKGIIAHMSNQQDNKGHFVVIKPIQENGKVVVKVFDNGEVKDFATYNKEGYKFTGVILVDKNVKEVLQDKGLLVKPESEQVLLTAGSETYGSKELIAKYEELKGKLSLTSLTSQERLEVEKELVKIIFALQQKTDIPVSLYKETFEVLNEIVKTTPNIQEVYKTIYTQLSQLVVNQSIDELINSMPRIYLLMKVIPAPQGTDQQIKQQLINMLKSTLYQEAAIQVYTPELNIKDKGVILKLNDNNKLMVKVYGTNPLQDKEYTEEQAVSVLKELGVLDEGNLLVVSKGDLISAAKFGALPLASVLIHSHPQEATLKVSVSDRNAVISALRSVRNNFVINLTRYLIDKSISYESNVKHKEFEYEVKVKEHDIVDTVQRIISGNIQMETQKLKTPSTEAVMFRKDNYVIVFYEVSNEEKAQQEIDKYQRIKHVLGDKVVQFTASYKQIEDKWIVVLTKQPTEDVTTAKDYLKDIADIQIELWREKFYDTNLAEENWKQNYGVTSEGRVVLSNPIVISDTIPEDMPIGDLVKINEELLKTGLTPDKINIYWGRPKWPDIDPLGIRTVALLLVDQFKKGGLNIKELPKMIRSAA